MRLKHVCRALDIISIYHNLIASIRVVSSCMLPVIKINYFSIYSHFLIFFYFSLNKIHRSKLYFIKEGTMDCQLYSAVCWVENLGSLSWFMIGLYSVTLSQHFNQYFIQNEEWFYSSPITVIYRPLSHSWRSSIFYILYYQFYLIVQTSFFVL